MVKDKKINQNKKSKTVQLKINNVSFKLRTNERKKFMIVGGRNAIVSFFSDTKKVELRLSSLYHDKRCVNLFRQHPLEPETVLHSWILHHRKQKGNKEWKQHQDFRHVYKIRTVWCRYMKFIFTFFYFLDRKWKLVAGVSGRVASEFPSAHKQLNVDRSPYWAMVYKCIDDDFHTQIFRLITPSTIS